MGGQAMLSLNYVLVCITASQQQTAPHAFMPISPQGGRHFERRRPLAALASDVSGGSSWQERVYKLWLDEYPGASKRGNFLGAPCDKGSIMRRLENLSGMLGPEVAAGVAENEPKILLYTEGYVSEAWRLIKVLEDGSQAAGQDLTAAGVVGKNPGLLTCEAYGLSGPDLSSLDSQATIIQALRNAGFKADAYPTLITILFVVFLVGGRAVQ